MNRVNSYKSKHQFGQFGQPGQKGLNSSPNMKKPEDVLNNQNNQNNNQKTPKINVKSRHPSNSNLNNLTPNSKKEVKEGRKINITSPGGGGRNRNNIITSPNRLNNKNYSNNNPNTHNTLSTPQATDFENLLFNVQDDFKTLTIKNSKMRSLLIQSAQKINELNETVKENQERHKIEKTSLLSDLDKIMTNYKIYAESHRSTKNLKSELEKVKNDYDHNWNILKKEQNFVKILLDNALDNFRSTDSFFKENIPDEESCQIFHSNITSNNLENFKKYLSHINTVSYKDIYHKLEYTLMMNGYEGYENRDKEGLRYKGFRESNSSSFNCNENDYKDYNINTNNTGRISTGNISGRSTNNKDNYDKRRQYVKDENIFKTNSLIGRSKMKKSSTSSNLNLNFNKANSKSPHTNTNNLHKNNNSNNSKSRSKSPSSQNYKSSKNNKNNKNNHNRKESYDYPLQRSNLSNLSNKYIKSKSKANSKTNSVNNSLNHSRNSRSRANSQNSRHNSARNSAHTSFEIEKMNNSKNKYIEYLESKVKNYFDGEVCEVEGGVKDKDKDKDKDYVKNDSKYHSSKMRNDRTNRTSDVSSDKSFNNVMQDSLINSNSNVDFSFEKHNRSRLSRSNSNNSNISNNRPKYINNKISIDSDLNYNNNQNNSQLGSFDDKKISGTIIMNYKPKKEKELMCKKDDYIEILSIDSEYNTICGIINGKVGIVPYNIVDINES